MKSINNNLFKIFKSDLINDLSKVIGGSNTSTQYWINSVTKCENGLPIADLTLESDIDTDFGSEVSVHTSRLDLS